VEAGGKVKVKAEVEGKVKGRYARSLQTANCWLPTVEVGGKVKVKVEVEVKAEVKVKVEGKRYARPCKPQTACCKLTAGLGKEICRVLNR
jgi:hypothetical protein